ncbi:primosomal protein N' [Campylobacter pinnipediorum]|uniref:primosomal protein N' n=1 Tax=Campylobacter pinnipediorum TaxID=1965231 RepID=UPI00084DA6EF|nr:primosomal protein N' [Campylobacter pinnipediorum]
MQSNFYYKISFPGLNLEILTYKSKVEICLFKAVLVSLRSKKIMGFVISETTEPEFKTLEILEVLPFYLTSMQIELCKFISYYYTCEFGTSLSLFEPKIDNQQKKYNFTISNNRQKIFKIVNFAKKPLLSKEQQKAFEFIKNQKNSLLFGDTGSGKSEIYISLIREALNDNNQALFLMPEISLTPQMQTRLENYFGDSIGIWHSKITKKKKEQILKDLISGKIKLIAGARSALFLPFERLKIIIVDEEHDDSYKNSISNPHYNARDLAVFLSSKSDIKTVLGSATPNVTSFYKFPHFRLKGTFFKSNKNIIYDETETGLSQTIINQLQKTLASKKQAIICLPTRANFRYLTCKECADTIKCPFCSIGMSFYKKENILKCQYCEFKMPVTNTCDKCGSDMIEAKKIGTSELLEQLQNEFANANIMKFDRDEITTQNKLVKILKDFNNKKIDILVGTQMLSKGHDYHNVDLAIVMGVDELLTYPDFRAYEKTLSLVKQVSGRAGRKGDGTIILQTRQKDFFKKYIDDYDKFIQYDLEYRNNLYPPFYRILRVVISHQNDNTANEILNNLINITTKQKNINLIGYGKCSIEKIGSRFRYEILIRSKSYKSLINTAQKLKYKYIDKYIDIDIDPVNFS